jgi:hypothetical protein
MEWVRLSHESVTGRDGYSDFYKKDIRFNALGPVGDVVEEWICKGAYCHKLTLVILIGLQIHQQILQLLLEWITLS